MKLEEADCCYFNFDDERIIDDVSILEKIDNLHFELFGKEPVLFFDEIQNITGWEKFVNRMYEKGRKIFITGSNASILSSEIATSLTGRNKVVELLPFSFKEYLRFEKITVNINRLSTSKLLQLKVSFDKYFKDGGFPSFKFQVPSFKFQDPSSMF